jgi:hypothetical protein
MANDDVRNIDADRTDKQIDNRIDPEKVIPDPEQVERDRKEAEKIYGDQKDRKAS